MRKNTNIRFNVFKEIKLWQFTKWLYVTRKSIKSVMIKNIVILYKQYYVLKSYSTYLGLRQYNIKLCNSVIIDVTLMKFLENACLAAIKMEKSVIKKREQDDPLLCRYSLEIPTPSLQIKTFKILDAFSLSFSFFCFIWESTKTTWIWRNKIKQILFIIVT